MTRVQKISLLFLLLLAFLFRSFKLNTDLLFHRDQGLHSLSIYRLWHDHHLSLLGHPSDVDGLYHAPIYYWLMTPAYFVGGGDPVVASLFQISLEVLSLPLLFLAIKRLFGRKTAWLTLLLYVFSYGLISYSRWLVNVTPILPLSHLLLYLLTQKRPYTPLVISISSLIVGLITHLNAAIGVFLLPLLLFLSRPYSFSRLFLAITAFLLPATPLLLFDLRHQFVLSHAIINFLHSPDQGLTNPLILMLNNSRIFLGEINKVVFFPFILISSTLFFLGLWFSRSLKSRLLIYSYLFIPFFFLSFFKRGALSFFFVAALGLSLALVAHAISRLPARLSLVFTAAAIIFNLLYLPQIYQPTNALIPIGSNNLITIQDRKNIIDWVYQKSAGQPFSLWYYTLPYHQEEVWDYLFLTYAQDKFGYLPTATADFSPSELTTHHYFAIFEPDIDHPTKLASWFARTAEFGSPQSNYRSHDLHATYFYVNKLPL